MNVDYDVLWSQVYGDVQKYGPGHRHMKKIYTKLLSPLVYNTAVDVGCGNGDNLLLINDRNIKHLAGIDVSDVALEYARNTVSADYKKLDIQKDCIDYKFDLVFCSFLLEHVVDDNAALANLTKMCKKYIIISTIQGDYEFYKEWEIKIGHVRNYDTDELEEKLRQHQFKILRRIQWGFPFYSPVVRKLQRLESDIGTGKYDLKTKIIANFLYLLYFFNSSTKGDILTLLAVKD